MFVDKLVLELRAGKGGNGVIAWRKEKYLPKGGPYGGNGGKGGSIIIKSETHVYSLDSYRNLRWLKADDGQSGASNNRTGRNGKDLIVKVPLGTILRDAETQEIIYDFSEDAQEIVICRGGIGGKGNTHFKTPTNRAPTKCTPGKPGEIRQIELELKLIADIGFVGFPNAGKSTLMNRLSQVDVRVGAYPFTTLRPSLGMLPKHHVYSKPLVVADIPGIIEGAHCNRGLGFDFLRHIERTKALLFVIDISKVERLYPEEDLKVLKEELKQYKEELLDKPRVIALNKIDCLLDEETEELLHKFRKIFPNDIFMTVSGESGEGIEELIHLLNKSVTA